MLQIYPETFRELVLAASQRYCLEFFLRRLQNHFSEAIQISCFDSILRNFENLFKPQFKIIIFNFFYDVCKEFS